MKQIELKISQIKTNSENPRTISSDKFKKLVNSILLFPTMLNIRPIVVDDTMTALGGNMRLTALKKIAQMQLQDIHNLLYSLEEFEHKTGDEQQAILDHWCSWIEEPRITAIKASSLTMEQRKQFIVKDNVSFGSWDYDSLSNWDAGMLENWGIDSWEIEPIKVEQPIAPAEEEEITFEDALPDELQGLDLTPNELPKLTGDDDTPNKYITIVYGADEREALAKKLGMDCETLYRKIVWSLDDILTMRKEASNGSY